MADPSYDPQLVSGKLVLELSTGIGTGEINLLAYLMGVNHARLRKAIMGERTLKMEGRGSDPKTLRDSPTLRGLEGLKMVEICGREGEYYLVSITELGIMVFEIRIRAEAMVNVSKNRRTY